MALACHSSAPTGPYLRTSDVLPKASLCRTLPLFVIGYGLLNGLPCGQCRDWRQEKWTVVTAHAGMASHNLEEGKTTHFVVPRSWSGRAYLSLAAIRAVLQSNLPVYLHNSGSTLPRSAVDFAQSKHWRLSSATDAIPLPNPKPRAMREHFVVPSIGSREVAWAEWPNIRRFEHFL
jgi:hypothetical protein